MRSFAAITGVVAFLAAGASEAQPASRARFSLEEVQATLAVQGLDAWVLASEGAGNPVAVELVNPAGVATELWFFLIPAQGQPVALAHTGDAEVFEHLGDNLAIYTSARERAKALRSLLAGRNRVAMEYAPLSAIPSLSRISAATAKLVEEAGAKVVSSANLVQFTKSMWRPQGREAHYVAAHHLNALIKLALAHVSAELRAGRRITEYDVQQYILKGYAIRALVGDPPAVATGSNTADPTYSPSKANTKALAKGDLVRLTLWARLADAPRPIYANLSWMAFAGARVPNKYADAFAVVVAARDAALALIRDRLARRRSIKGFEPARAAREVASKAGMGQHLVHRTGHSLDTSVIGDGAHLDDDRARDTRALIRGAGFTVEPGLYVSGEFGVKTEINVFLGREGLEVTSPAQAAITPLLPAP